MRKNERKIEKERQKQREGRGREAWMVKVRMRRRTIERYLCVCCVYIISDGDEEGGWDWDVERNAGADEWVLSRTGTGEFMGRCVFMSGRDKQTISVHKQQHEIKSFFIFLRVFIYAI